MKQKVTSMPCIIQFQERGSSLWLETLNRNAAAVIAMTVQPVQPQRKSLNPKAVVDRQISSSVVDLENTGVNELFEFEI